MNTKKEELKKNIELLDSTKDADFKALIQEEIDRILTDPEFGEKEDVNNAIIEIRAGTGGEEAELFASELARMYLKYAEKQGCKVEIQNKKENSIGGLEEFTATIIGPGAYGKFKYEAGVHRVQRVPETEKRGRIHTSAASVAVLPQIEEKEVEISPQDLRIDVYRSGGHGGQSVNTTDSAVRITHLPTGIVVICQDERSQLKNKAKAMGVLRAKVWQENEDRKNKATQDRRTTMVGSGDRSEKIRTYNYPQDRITDHRIPKSWNNMQKYLDGNLDPIIEEIKATDKRLILEKVLAE